MRTVLPVTAAIACLMLFACRKKEKSVTYTGRLLFTHNNPYPIANRNVRIDQYGNGGALGGSTFAAAGTQTDATGAFRIVFTPGTSTFLLITSTNINPLTLSGTYSNDSTLRFSRSNFPDSAYDASKSIYIAKTIDTAIFKVQVLTALSASDTIGLRGYTTAGILDKQYTGRTAAQGSIIVLDTIYNMLFTEYDCRQKSFINTLYGGLKYTTSSGYVSFSYGYISPLILTETDQGNQEFQFYFRK